MATRNPRALFGLYAFQDSNGHALDLYRESGVDGIRVTITNEDGGDSAQLSTVGAEELLRALIAVKDPVTTTAELDALPVGAVVRTAANIVAERTDWAWRLSGAAGEYQSWALSLPARVIDLPEPEAGSA